MILSDPTDRIIKGMLPSKHCPHAYDLLKEDQVMISMGLMPEQATSHNIRTECPFCGSKNIRIGCPYQDCSTCTDIETSECNRCKSVWAGAMYRK